MPAKTQICKRGHDTYVTGRSDNGTCRACSREQATAWRLANPGRYRALMRSKKGMINPPQERPEGPCENAGCDYVGLLVCDHDHATGIVRGWLCANCNIGLGRFKDDEKRMLGAIDYLARHGKK